MAVFSVVELAGIAVGLVTAPITTRLLTLEQYGALPLLGAVWAVITVLQFGGMETAFILCQARASHDARAVTVTTSLVAAASLAIVWLAFAAVCLLSPWLYSLASVTSLEMAAFLVWILANGMVAWQLHLLRFMHQAVRYARVTLIVRIASVIFALPAMYVVTQEYRLAVGLLVYAIFGWVSLMLAVREVRASGGAPYERAHWDSSLVRPMLGTGLSLAPAAFVYALFSVTDRLLLGSYTTPADVAVFALAGAVAGAALVFKLGFARTWDPYMLEWVTTRDEQKYLPRLQLGLDVIAFALPLGTILALVWSEPLFRWLFPPAYARAAEVTPILVLAGLVSTLALVCIATETISGRTRYRLPIYVFGLAINAAVCIGFIPRYGVVAAAYGTLAGEIAIVLLWIVVGQWILGNLRLRWTSVAVSAAIALGLAAWYAPGSLMLNRGAELLVVTALCIGLGWFVARQAWTRMSDLQRKVP
jgi:O-antigen/teichoic acid export membrane protein